MFSPLILLGLTTVNFAQNHSYIISENTPVDEPPIVPPPLIIPTLEGYTEHPVNQPLPSPNGQPIGRLTRLPANLARKVHIYFPRNNEPLKPDQIGYRIRSSIRYIGDSSVILVTVAVPSPAAAKKKTLLGNKQVRLKDNTIAFSHSSSQSDTPNRLVFYRGNLIITVASNLPLDQVVNLASEVELSP